MLIYGILIPFLTGCELATFNPWGAASSLLQPDAASLTSDLHLFNCVLRISIGFSYKRCVFIHLCRTYFDQLPLQHQSILLLALLHQASVVAVPSQVSDIWKNFTVQLFSENYSEFYGVRVISRVQIIPPSPFPDQETPSGVHPGPSYQPHLSVNVYVFTELKNLLVLFKKVFLNL